jgi:hypothetical protein
VTETRERIIRLGDYMNGRFSVDEEFVAERLEHDLDGVSIVMRRTYGGKPQGHVHLNIPEQLLSETAAAHLRAQSLRQFYSGHEPWPPPTRNPAAESFDTIAAARLKKTARPYHDPLRDSVKQFAEEALTDPNFWSNARASETSRDYIARRLIEMLEGL